MNSTRIVIDTDKHEAHIHEGKAKPQKIHLTPKEKGLLINLTAAGGRVLAREYLLERVWGKGPNLGIDTRTVDQHIARLREKLGKVASQHVETVSGYGYQVKGGVTLLGMMAAPPRPVGTVADVRYGPKDRTRIVLDFPILMTTVKKGTKQNLVEVLELGRGR